MLQTVFQSYHINIPDEEELRNVRAGAEKQVTLEEYMVEILIEENHLKRYEAIKTSDVSIVPTEEDLWERIVPQTAHRDLGTHISIDDLKLKAFDRIIESQSQHVRMSLEQSIASAKPLFGEETGEFVDFTSPCVRLKGF